MSEFVTVAKTQDIPPGTGRTVEVQGVWIALFNVDGAFREVTRTKCNRRRPAVGADSAVD